MQVEYKKCSCDNTRWLPIQNLNNPHKSFVGKRAAQELRDRNLSPEQLLEYQRQKTKERNDRRQQKISHFRQIEVARTNKEKIMLLLELFNPVVDQMDRQSKRDLEADIDILLEKFKLV